MRKPRFDCFAFYFSAKLTFRNSCRDIYNAQKSIARNPDPIRVETSGLPHRSSVIRLRLVRAPISSYPISVKKKEKKKENGVSLRYKTNHFSHLSASERAESDTIPRKINGTTLSRYIFDRDGRGGWGRRDSRAGETVMKWGVIHGGSNSRRLNGGERIFIAPVRHRRCHRYN